MKKRIRNRIEYVDTQVSFIPEGSNRSTLTDHHSTSATRTENISRKRYLDWNSPRFRKEMRSAIAEQT